jgi:hypothetical protein
MSTALKRLNSVSLGKLPRRDITQKMDARSHISSVYKINVPRTLDSKSI